MNQVRVTNWPETAAEAYDHMVAHQATLYDDLNSQVSADPPDSRLDSPPLPTSTTTSK